MVVLALAKGLSVHRLASDTPLLGPGPRDRQRRAHRRSASCVLDAVVSTARAHAPLVVVAELAAGGTPA